MAALILAREQITAQLRELTTEQLRQDLADRLGLTAESLLRTACLVAILEERGEDLSGLKIGIVHHLRRIAQGELLPEIVVRFAGNARSICQIGELPVAQQQRILDGTDPVPILRLNGQSEKRHASASRKTPGADRDYRRFQESEELTGRSNASPRDVAEHLFKLAIKHGEPKEVARHLRRLLEEWEAGGKRQRVVLSEVEGE